MTRAADQTTLPENRKNTAAVTFTQNGAYSASTDSYATVSTATTAIQMAPSRFYKFEVMAESETKSGDLTVFVATSAITPKVGSRFTMLSKSYQVLQVEPASDAWALRVRLA